MANQTQDRNKAIVRDLTDAWNRRDREGMAALYADEVTVHGDGPETRRKDDQIEMEWEFFEAFPDAEATTEQLLAEDDSVLVRWSVVGTHEGEIDGIEPTGNVVEYEEWVISWIVDGLVVEFRALRDTLDLLQQLDAVEWPPN